MPLEKALGAFDLFIAQGCEWSSEGVSMYQTSFLIRLIKQISVRLDELACKLRSRYPDILELSPRRKAKLIAQYLRGAGFTGTEDASRYLNIQNNFLGITLCGAEHPILPLNSVAVYCSIANRLNLNAKPCNYPWHVFAVVYSNPGQDLDGNKVFEGVETEVMYMDPFRTHLEIPAGDLLAQLQTMGVSRSDYPSYMMGASVIDITLRSARNIIYSIQSAEQTVIARGPRSATYLGTTATFPDREHAFYGALWASLLLGMPSNGDISPRAIATTRNRRQFLSYILKRIEVDFPFDVSLIEEHVLPIFETHHDGRHLREMIRDMRNADSKPKPVKTRIGGAEYAVLYKVGQVFQHKRYHYQAVITGWDAECAADEMWITQMGVDTLARGRHQSFYHAL